MNPCIIITTATDQPVQLCGADGAAECASYVGGGRYAQVSVCEAHFAAIFPSPDLALQAEADAAAADPRLILPQ